MSEGHEPTPEDLAFLNALDAGYIGYEKPHVSRVTKDTLPMPEPKLYKEYELEIEDGDHLRTDEQPFEPEEEQ